MKNYQHYHLHQLLAVTLVISSTLQIASPLHAEGVTAGSAIKNTATGEFSDGTIEDGKPKIYNTTSNEVIINVAEVAGINITAQPPTNIKPNAGDTLNVEFEITNIGNDPTQFFIPDIVTLKDKDGNVTTSFTVDPTKKIQVVINGVTKDLPVGGIATGDTSFFGETDGSIVPGGKVRVIVPIKVLDSANTGDTLKVSLGKTSTDNQQNEKLVKDGGDVYTVDNANGKGGENNTTTPDEKEAMDTTGAKNSNEIITVGDRKQAFATILKAISNYDKNSTSIFTDDILTYKLALRVENSTSIAGVSASELYGTKLSVDGDTTESYVLVSDAIPNKMKLGSATPTAPSNDWIPVYTTTSELTPAHQAEWKKFPFSGTTKATRVGFIYKTTATAGLAKATYKDFTFTVTPDGFTGGQIANIAQVFGQSQPGEPKQLVYDESGDQTPNNGLGETNPSGETGDEGGITDGVANINKDGVDSGKGSNPTANDTNQGTNGGSGPNDNGTKTIGGEVTLYKFAIAPLNGPDKKPEAIGPVDSSNPTGNADNDHDFTNKSLVVPANKKPTDLLTDVETKATIFNNTAQNTSSDTEEITLEPKLFDTTELKLTDKQLPDGTTITITADGKTAVYESSNGTLVLKAGNTPIKVSVVAGGLLNYTVEINLPGDVPQLQSYPVKIVAFVDDGTPGYGSEPSNITIDRLYTNYLQLVKKARILESDRTTEVVGFSEDGATLDASAKPGRIIEYQITYTNISFGGGVDNVVLPAKDLVITEDGAIANGNNWFDSTIDSVYNGTGNGSAVGTNPSVTTASNGTKTDIKVYKDTITVVLPQGTGKFTFQRQIKDSGSTSAPIPK
ncbi:MAG: hypothetical protein HC903_28625 [Methylacidiphilales bacterium]|nr:hypothetical protein [Candidatus Methylacidiphilales bacterium]